MMTFCILAIVLLMVKRYYSFKFKALEKGVEEEAIKISNFPFSGGIISPVDFGFILTPAHTAGGAKAKKTGNILLLLFYMCLILSIFSPIIARRAAGL